MTALRVAMCLVALSACFSGLGHRVWGSGSAFAGEASEDTIHITIHARKFDPPVITLQAGRKTHLILRNQDAELHAFVPGTLFAGVNVNVGGNGAPEFGETGFRKVIIPSGGHVDIRFMPESPGIYPYLCDMPGHEMQGAIVVE